MRWLAWMVVLVGLALASAAQALEPATTGVVLLHGKWGDPSGVRPLKEAAEAAGFLADSPALPWAGTRLYDRPFEAAMDEIAAAANRLTAMGAKRIVVAGHSLGGNAALYFTTLGHPLAAAVLVAPAHFPEGKMFLDKAADSVARAQEMVAAGEGGDVGSFLSLNSGNRSRLLQVKAAIYLSYYAPDAPAAMSLAAPKVRPVPLLWVAPSADPSTQAFDQLVAPHLPPGTPLTRIDVTADHMGAPEAGADAVVEWLKGLPD